jgi:hypothetical protein
MDLQARSTIYGEMFASEFIEELASKLAEKMPRPHAVELSFGDLGIELLKAYTAKEAAHYPGCHPTSVYEISEMELPKVRRAGTGVGYLGINILLYVHGLPPVDVKKRLEAYRDALTRNRPAVQPLHPETRERTRVL